MSLRALLMHPLWCDAPDAEVADEYGCSPKDVRLERDQMERDALSAEVLTLAREIAAVTGSGLPLSDIVRQSVEGVLRRAKSQEASVRQGDSKSSRTGSDRPGDSGGLRGRQSSRVARRGLGPSSSVSKEAGRGGNVRRAKATGDGQTARSASSS